jgi:hypothetical protein
MKVRYLLCLLGLFCMSAHAQPFVAPASLFTDDLPAFVQKSVRTNRIKAVRVRSYPGSEPAGMASASSLVCLYDDYGNLRHKVEFRLNDTARVHRYLYTHTGTLGWHTTEDKLLRKSYRLGYRFDANHKTYQVKSYEVLNAQERMLIGTRHYIYDADSALVAIRHIESGRVVQTQRYAYDAQGNLITVTDEDAAGRTARTTRISYNGQGLIARVQTEEQGRLEAYTIQYDSRGNMIRVDWTENQQPRGQLAYSYSSEGLLARATRTTAGRNGALSVTTQLFEYEYN